MFINIVILIISFIVLIKGADVFVDGASNLAQNFKISKMLIGLTIVSFGTSAPEFAVSIKSIISGAGDIVLGNVVGSNIINILLILGLSSLVHELTVKNNTVKKELPITLLLTTLLVVLMNDKILNGQTNILTRGDGIALLLFFCVFIYYLFTMMRNKIDEDNDNTPKYSLLKSLFLTVTGIVAIVLGSHFVVESSSFIATKLGVSQRIIGLTIIALGTSLPELVTSVMASKKGEYDIAIGNIVGSNIFNISIVLGLPVALFGNINVGQFNILDLTVLLTSAFALYIFAAWDHKLRKSEGIVFLLIFVFYYTMILI